MYPVLKTSNRLRIRELSSDDIDDLAALYGDPVVTQNLSFDPRKRESVETILGNAVQAAHVRPRREYVLAVETIDGEFVGVARLAIDTADVDLPGPSDETPSSAQLGGAITAQRWRQGFGLEAAGLLIALGFDDLNLHRLWGARSPANDASGAMMNRLGMHEEGRIRHHVFTDGAWRDSIVHSILRIERQPALRVDPGPG